MRMSMGSCPGPLCSGLLVAVALLAGCAWFRVPEPEEPSAPRVRVVRDPQLMRRVAELELQALEKHALIEDLQARLDEAHREVVRAMAKLQTLASRAEAASAIAEAEIALQALRDSVGLEKSPELAQGRQLLQLSSQEFNQQNYGGAIYLANQAKGFVRAGWARLAEGRLGSLRPDEVLFAVPIGLRSAALGNVRTGPGLNYRVAFTVQPGEPLTGHSHLGEWVRVSDENGRSGWMHRTLVGRPTGVASSR